MTTYENATHTISISMDGQWAGDGKIVNGEIVDCGAQFCGDNDKNLDIYDDIVDAISHSQIWILVDIDDVQHKIEWSMTTIND